MQTHNRKKKKEKKQQNHKSQTTNNLKINKRIKQNIMANHLKTNICGTVNRITTESYTSYKWRIGIKCDLNLIENHWWWRPELFFSNFVNYDDSLQFISCIISIDFTLVYLHTHFKWSIQMILLLWIHPKNFHLNFFWLKKTWKVKRIFFSKTN